MTKIAKLTWLHNGNYGSTLQALALQKFLKDNYFDVVDINYNASTKTKLINWVENRNSPELFIRKFQERKAKMQFAYPELFIEREKKFKLFQESNMTLSSLYRTPHEVKNVSNDYDIFICGSDQIWSPALMNPVFYLDCIPKNKVKIAYAPSFGVLNLSKYKKKRIAKFLESFNYISVRETQGQQLVKEIINKEVPVQVDPTMLLSKTKWSEYTGERIEKDKYIFCYLLKSNSLYIEAVRRISIELNIKVIIVPTIKGPFQTGFNEYIDIGPSEWLNYIQNAEIVYTDSYHGGIFSAVFEKEFFLFKRFSDNDYKSENSRVYTLIKLLGVEERLIDSDNIHLMKGLDAINYTCVKSRIEKEANRSGEWILDILKAECK